MEDLKTLKDHSECYWDYIDHLRMALAAACKERDELKKAYDAMARDLQFRTEQVRELQEENHASDRADLVAEIEKLRKQLEQTQAERDAAIAGQETLQKAMAEFLIDLADDGNLRIMEWLQQPAEEE